MFSFFKRKNKLTKHTPDWAGFFSPENHSRFIQEIEAYFMDIDISINNEGVITVNTNDFGLKNFGLLNLAQQCKQVSREEYQEVITKHFSALKSSYVESQSFDAAKNDFSTSQKLIAIRLYNKADVQAVGKEQLLGYDLIGDLYAMLVYDLPETIVSVSSKEAELWGKSQEELYELGIRNIQKKYSPKLEQHTVSGINLWLAEDQHFFVPNILFELDENRYLLGTYGALFAAPTRTTAIIYPIESDEVVQAINGLIPIVHNLNSDGPGSLSNHLFWYLNDTFIDLPYTIVNNKLSFEPPTEFIELLEKLTQQ